MNLRTFTKYLVNLLKVSVYLPNFSWSNVFGKFVLIVKLVDFLKTGCFSKMTSKF